MEGIGKTSLLRHICDVEITCRHRSFSVHRTKMTDHYYRCLVGVTDHLSP